MDEQCGKSTNHNALPLDVPLIGRVNRAIQVITFLSSIRKKVKLLDYCMNIYNNKNKYILK